eukprot:CAMPEP_0204826148 /NCGR_PEP_ID=MMETSP1346-20131115/3888_1 /ASSEMBLY_ACC=CAM_ASM_000771 /TAXON_ID=215587 /ORGANISM="Aplanochytrium stocchinoi, Strain GSBS06" /LENGTH=208 /DNA_ID=CAMNT_0051954033 /DNA_START=188 /DNA_END=814 /DNA_ORIENTATION=+
MATNTSSLLLVVDPFCLRQFNLDSTTSNKVDMPKEEFEKRVNEELQQSGGLKVLKDGYAPFCKHFFVENFTCMQSAYVEITASNLHLLRTGYNSRTEKELKVLERWFPRDLMVKNQDQQKAKYLDCILYSREQIKIENEKMGERVQETDAPWGIVSIKAQDVDYELPMNPITQMRNALGKSYGGSGVPLDPQSYNQSVEFWSKHAVII